MSSDQQSHCQKNTSFISTFTFNGVYANATTLEECREELEEVLEGWILLRVSLHYPLPSVDGVDLVVGEVA